MDGKGNKNESVKRRKYNIKKEKDQDLRPCFLLSLHRQGRSLWLPTLPSQQTNRYAVVGSIQMLFLLQTRINHANRYAVDGSMQMLFLLQTRINHANCYAVVSSMQMLFLLPTRINHANCYVVVGAIQMLFLLPTRINHSNCYGVDGAISGSYILYLLKTYAILSCTRIFVWPYRMYNVFV